MVYFWFCLTILGLLFIYNCGQPVAIYLHYILNPFIYGVSKFKINFFLSYFLLLAALTAWPGINGTNRIINRLKLALFMLIGTALAANWLSFILFIRRFSLPLDKYAYHFKGYFHSINYFAHIHTGKVIIYDLLNLLRLNSFNNYYDTGLVFAEYVPHWLVLIMSFSVVASFILFLLLLKPALKAWQGSRSFVLFLIYSFAGAHILKCLVDGGVFSYDLLPSLIALHLVLTSNSPTVLIDNFQKRWKIYLLVSFLYLCLCSVISINEGFLQVPFGFIFSASLYTLLFIALIAPSLSLRSVMAVSACSLIIAGYWTMHGLSAINSMRQEIAAGDRVLLYDYSDPGGQLRAIDRSSGMLGKTILAVYRQLGENPLRNRRVAIIRPSNDSCTGLICALKIIKGNSIKLDSNDLIRIESIKPWPEFGARAYLMKIALNPEVTPSLWSWGLNELDEENKYAVLFLLDHYFTARGIDEFAIIPYYFYKVGKI